MYLYCEILDLIVFFINLQKLTDHYKNLEDFILWGGMLYICSCLYGLISLWKSYLRLYFVRICFKF